MSEACPHTDWGLCIECWEEARDAQNRAEREAALVWAAGQGLPTLTGTDKQVEWAATIRHKMITSAEHVVTVMNRPLEADPADDRDAGWVRVDAWRAKVTAEDAIDGLRALREVTSARWWIDNRDSTLTYLLRWGALKGKTAEHEVLGFNPNGKNTLTIPAEEVVEERDTVLVIALPLSQWEGCTTIVPRSKTTTGEDGAVTVTVPATFAFTITDGRHEESVTAEAMYMDRVNRLPVPADPYRVPPCYQERGWSSFDVPTEDVTRLDGAASVVVAMTYSRWEGLNFRHPGSLVTDHGDGTSTVRFGPDWRFKLSGGERVLPVTRRALWEDRTQPLPVPGESLAVEQRDWAELAFHPDRVREVRNARGWSRSVMIRFPLDATFPGAVVFHPKKLTATEVVFHDDGGRERVPQFHRWRHHDEWAFKVKTLEDDEVTFTPAEFAEVIADWALTDPAHDPTVYVPETLTPVEHVIVPDELVIEEGAA